MKRYSFWIKFSHLILISCALGACVRSKSVGVGIQGDFPFLPPTLVPTSVPNPTATPMGSSVQGSNTENPSTNCVDSLTFLSDVTIPDGTEVKAGSTIDKRWEVRNNGTCNWDDHYKVHLLAGNEMGVKPEQALFPARSGSTAVIRIVFTAPNEPGKHRSAWQAYNPNNQPFGDPFYIEILVK
jgi:hypothetical protein